MSQEAFLTEEELARRWKLAPRTLRRYRARRQVPFVQLFGEVRYNPQTIAELERRWTVAGRWFSPPATSI